MVLKATRIVTAPTALRPAKPTVEKSTLESRLAAAAETQTIESVRPCNTARSAVGMSRVRLELPAANPRFHPRPSRNSVTPIQSALDDVSMATETRTFVATENCHTSGEDVSGGADILPVMPVGRVGLDAGSEATGVLANTRREAAEPAVTVRLPHAVRPTLSSTSADAPASGSCCPGC